MSWYFEVNRSFGSLWNHIFLHWRMLACFPVIAFENVVQILLFMKQLIMYCKYQFKVVILANENLLEQRKREK